MTLLRYSTLVTTAVALPVCLFAQLWAEDAAAVRAAAFGGSLAALNAIVAYSTVRWVQGRRTNVFLGAILGGMLGRMALMLGAMVAGLVVLELPRVPMLVSLLGYFVLFLVFEIRFLPRSVRSEAAL